MEHIHTNDSDNIIENQENDTVKERPAPDTPKREKKTGETNDVSVNPNEIREIPDPDADTQLGTEEAAPGNMIPEDVPELPWIKVDGDDGKPEINPPGENLPNREIGLPPKPKGPQVLNQNSTYSWSYGDRAEHKNSKRRSQTGVLTYAVVITIAFAICLTLLIGLMLPAQNENGRDDKLPADTTIPVTSDTEPADTTANTAPVNSNPSNDGNPLPPPYDTTGGSDGVINPETTGSTTPVNPPTSGEESLTKSQIFELVSPSVVGITVYYNDIFGSIAYATGTGFILTEDGYIATNYHVTESGKTFIVKIYDGTDYTAEYIGGDEQADLAVLKIQASGLKPVKIGNSDNIKAGESVVVIGYPVSMDYALTITDGIISSPSRDIKKYDSNNVLTKKMKMIQTNAAVNPGNSGGPLIDMNGCVIGVVTAKLMNDIEGMGFAIPINGAYVILQEIIQTGTSTSTYLIVSKRPLLGITAGPVFEGQPYEYNEFSGVADISGVLVVAVSENSGANGLLKPGDIITQVDGKYVYYTEAISDIINNKFAGDTVTVTFYRDGRYQTVEIKLIAAD